MRHIVITGAASGIGLETARRFAADGDLVTLADLRHVALSDALETVTAQGSCIARSVTVDLRSETSCNELVDNAWAHAPIDVLVNCAGIYPATPFLDLDGTTWDNVQTLNVRAPMLTTVALARRAIAEKRTPSIVNISSGAALRARTGAAPYSTSKAALEMLTRASALELGPHGIRVNAVAPGFVTVNSSINPVTDEYADAVGATPLGRRGRPEDIAGAVLWLSGRDAHWVTGEVIRIDGGASTGAWQLPLHWTATPSNTPTEELTQ
ncbi:short-chain dehydrogenase [Rhodococcus sp. KBW08]|uniref:SDR family NAD(P)-dependent oxidoreductase n=1 Tax=Rhodococcus sp. KBW08 TaxID=2144188 RepID=UPI000F5ADA5C|nr:SDR family oxidoreductase [Rhodococcus sp. KBW08]RQO46040.1 short-chain dehydrogenase [Rhodococcus sp. KBW08]